MSAKLPRRPLLAALPLASLLIGARANAQSDMMKIQKHIFTVKSFRLESGVVMPEVAIAYETYGTLAPDGRNAVLLTHGFTSSQHMAGRYAEGGAEGSWNGLVGPGKAIDTDRLFVVSSNMLGSSYGSTSPAHLNPKTGKVYGPDFPEITLVDIVNAQKALLDSIGVKHLVAVAGPSFGGYQTFQWGVSYPDFMDGLVPVVSAPKGSGSEAAVKSLIDTLAKDPHWNGGWYYENGGIPGTLEQIRYETLLNYGQGKAEAKVAARGWAKIYDGHSLVTLRRAIDGFDITHQYDRLKQTKVLYVISKTDKLFDLTSCAAHALDMRKAGIDITYVEMPSDKGHMASHADAAMWAPILDAFMKSL